MMRSCVTGRAFAWSILWPLLAGVAPALAQEGSPSPGATVVAATAPVGSPSSRRVIEEAALLAGGLPVQLNKALYREGEPMVVTVDVLREGYLNVISVGPDGIPTVLFPNQQQRDNRVPIGVFTIPNAQMKFDLKAKPPHGATLVAAFLSKESMDFYASAEGDRDAQGAMQEPFAQLSATSRSKLRQLAAKSFVGVPRAAPLLGGVAYGVVCAASGPCDAANVPGGPAAIALDDKLTPGSLLESRAEANLLTGVKPRPISDKGLRLTKLSEGFVPRLYVDGERHCGIAYGHLVKKALCDGNEPAQFRRGLSEAQAESLLVQDMRRAQLAVMSLVKTPLSDGQYAALSDFTYNVGTTKLQESTLLKAVNAGEHHRVPSQLRRWTMANGKEHPGLKTRREREIQLYFEGEAIPVAAPGEEDLTAIDIRRGE